MAPIPTQDRFVSTPDGRLFTRRWQAAASLDRQDVPLVLFHDSIGSIELWRDFPEHLMRETGRDVIAYDRLGFGQSDPLVTPLPAGFVADEARTNFKAVHDGLGIDGYVAVGHSVGGAMALGCATVYPDCRALVSIATQTYPEDRTLEGIAKAREDFRVPEQFARIARYHGDKTAWVLSNWIDRWLDPAFLDWNLDEVLPRVGCPVLAIHGDQDEYGTTTHAERIANETAGPGTLILVAGGGHLPHREQPAAIARQVADWLASLPRH